MNINIKKLLLNIPLKPGVYLFKNKTGKVIYIGKAKVLKNRVNSYFTKSSNLEMSKINMLSKIEDIDYIITKSEYEALLLESNLIKQYKPTYNVRLKDDKNYLYIKIENINEFPKIYTVRKIDDAKASYFGPFTDSQAVKQTLKLLRKLFPYRDCSENLFNKNKECLKYHIKQCLAPCIGAVSHEEYNNLIRNCELFLIGKRSKLIRNFKSEMNIASQNKQYEKAANYRDQIKSLSKIVERQTVISTKKESQDYISYVKYRENYYINLFIVREGKIIGRENFIINNIGNFTDDMILESFIKEYYLHTFDFPTEIILQIKILNDSDLSSLLSKKSKKKVKIITATRGKKREVIRLGIQNAKNFLTKKIGPIENAKYKKLLQSLKLKLNLPHNPKRIECYDISNIQGKFAVGSMIVFTNGQPDKKEYRKFKIKSVVGANDVAMMEEVVSRRLNNVSWPYPDLIIVDGGKPQLNQIKKLLNIKNLTIPLISLAKKEEEIYLTNKKYSLKLKKDSEVLKLIQRIRDEAHRFAISYHKKLRAKTL